MTITQDPGISVIRYRSTLANEDRRQGSRGRNGLSKVQQCCGGEDPGSNEERCKLAMEATSDGIWDWNVQTSEVFYSPSFFCMLGYDADNSTNSLCFWENLIHPEDRELVLAENLGCIEGRCEQFQLEYRLLARDGNWLWILCRGKAITRDRAGRALRMVGTHENISRHKELEDRITRLVAEKDLLLRDVHHRVKNNLSTLRSLLSLQSQSMRSKLAASALQVAAGRVQSMAVLYDRLYLSDDYGHLSSLDFVSELVDQILCNFPAYEKIVVIKEIDDIQLPQKTVTGLSLIINELLTNAMKYAFNNREKGLIRIRLQRSPGGFNLEIQDDGPGFMVDQTGEWDEGFGLMLVHTLVDQLKGKLEIVSSAGTLARMEVPLTGGEA